MKVGVLVVAYNAESTLVDVLERIAPPMRAQLDEVLVLDDHSRDATFAVATGYRGCGAEVPLTVVRQPANLGYGGNQKSGYTYAINHGWDVVVLLHGDGQYAPEVMAELVAPITEGRADAVLGSRMMSPGGARRGGMPAYKYIGNRVLTSLQNAITGMQLSEWHSGYRAYRVESLAEIDFLANSDGFDFDTEIILQLHAAGSRIDEVPIPTYYGNEICRVNGLAYARDVIIDTVRHRLGRAGFGDGALGHVDPGYTYKPSPRSSHGRVLQMVEHRPPMRMLDVGCGAGWLAEALQARGHHVTGVDVGAVAGVSARMAHFVPADLEDGVPDTVGGGFDLIVAADVIEHVRRPERLLADLAGRLRSGGTIIASVPNVAHWYPRARSALGMFGYDQRGILDTSHLRFFTRRGFLRLVRRVGLSPLQHRHTGLPYESLGVSAERRRARLAAAADRASVRLWPTMFAYQFVYELAVSPALDVADDRSR